jgi:hypothetical protein
MQSVVLSALLAGGALAVTCALAGSLMANSVGTSSRFHPGRMRRLIHRLMFGVLQLALGFLLAMCIAFILQTRPFAALPSGYTGALGAALWLASFDAFGSGYRFASRRRMLRALDSGIAVGLH